MADDGRHKELLRQLHTKTQAAYDKTVISLSTGAIGISLVFVGQIKGDIIERTGWLVAAWVAWALSACAVVLSFMTSKWALQRAIDDKNYGVYDLPTKALNLISGPTFILGVVLMFVFACGNFGPPTSDGGAP